METQINEQMTKLTTKKYVDTNGLKYVIDRIEGQIKPLDASLVQYISDNEINNMYVQDSIRKLRTINMCQSIATALLSIALILHLIGG